MSHWYTTTLGELLGRSGGLIRTGPFGSQLHADEYIADPSGVPVVMPKNMVDGRILETGIKRVSESTAERLHVHRCVAGDLLLARRGDVGRLAFVDSEYSGCLCGTGSMRIHVTDHEVVDPHFLRYLMQAPMTTDWLTQHAVGATMPNLNEEIVGAMPVAVPPSEDQRQVALILHTFDELIEINERRIEHLEILARSLGRLWLRPRDRKLGSAGRISDLAELRVEGVDPGDFDPSDRYIGLEHLPRRSTTLRAWSSIDRVKSRKLRFRPGDTLFGKIRPNLHKVVWAPFSGLASSDTMVFRPLEGKAVSGFLNLILSSDETVAQASLTANGTKMPRADPKVLLDYPVFIPNDDILTDIEKMVASWLDWAALLTTQAHAFRQIRDLLLPRLVTGQVDISDVELGVLTPAEPE